jgi:hypothetical protein
VAFELHTVGESYASVIAPLMEAGVLAIDPADGEPYPDRPWSQATHKLITLVKRNSDEEYALDPVALAIEVYRSGLSVDATSIAIDDLAFMGAEVGKARLFLDRWQTRLAGDHAG